MWSDIHFINIHYELTTGTFPPNTVWFGEETDVWWCVTTDFANTPFMSRLALTGRRNERNHSIQCYWAACIHCSLSHSAPHTNTHSTLHISVQSVPMFWLLHVCLPFGRSDWLSIRLYCRSHNSACAHLEHMWMLNRLIVANFAPIRHKKTSESDITSFFR